MNSTILINFNRISKKIEIIIHLYIFLIIIFIVPETGLEPAHSSEYWSLKPARLPIPPFGH